MKTKQSELFNKTGAFALTLHDRNGERLNMGDIVKVSNRGEFSFYSEVKYLADEKKIAPFHTFSFHSFEKVNNVPDHAKLSTEPRYKIWFINNPEADNDAEKFEDYLMDWRACEHEIDSSCFRIELIK